MKFDELLWKLEGLHTVETAAEVLGVKRQSALNILCRLKKEGYVTTSGGGKQKRLYKVSMRRQWKRVPGMFDILNRHSPNMKLNPWYDHQVHGHYGPEEALIDALQTENFRVILVSMRLFSHITDWRKLYRLAHEKDCWQKVGALYDVARMFFRVRKMPEDIYINERQKRWQRLTQLRTKNFPDIAQKWRIYISFNKNDVREII